MTIAAIDGGFREVDMPHVQLHGGRLVAVDAGNGAMQAQERELCLSMIEPGQIFPLARGVASLATERFTGRIEHCHSLRKLPLMHIFMAGCAIETSEMIRRYFRTGHRLVAVIAGHRSMAAGEWEARLLVLGQCVG